MCFHPRHGIHLTRADQVTDLVICFECNQVKVFVDAQSSEGFFTTSSPHEVFDNALKEAGLPVAELPEDPDVECPGVSERPDNLRYSTPDNVTWKIVRKLAVLLHVGLDGWVLPRREGRRPVGG